MTKQEEIRKGIGDIIDGQGYYFPWDSTTKAILAYLHSQGGMLKVKCPDCEWSQFIGGESAGMVPCHTCNSTGYIYEPLIKEEYGDT